MSQVVVTDGVEHWEHDTYEPLAIVPVSGMRAVYGHKAEDKSKWYRESFPIHFIGIAKCTTTKYSRPEGHKGGATRRETVCTIPVVVGYEVSEGGIHVVNEAVNFFGLLEEAGDMKQVGWSQNTSDYPDELEVDPPNT